MPYCQVCGRELDENAAFCSGCGSPVGKNSFSNRQQEYAGKIIKCPNCGETLASFATTCPACGYELRGAQTVSAVRELEIELKRIESEREVINEFNKKTTLREAFAQSLIADHNRIDDVDEKLAARITNFAIPNTREDIFEFLILASSNIDPDAYDTSGSSYSGKERAGKQLVSNAWISKYNQALQKARLMFPDDPRLNQIEDLYHQQKKAVKGSKSRGNWAWIFLVAIGALCFALLIGMLIWALRKEDRLDKQLNATVAEIQEDIANEDYDEALIKANTLRFDESIDHEKAKQWDEQREEIIKLIKEKKKESNKKKKK